MADSPTALNLSAPELKALTGWEDSVIVEFLSLTGSVATIVNNMNIVINNVTSSLTLGASNTALLTKLSKSLALLGEQVTQLDGTQATIVGLRKSLRDAITQGAQVDAALGSLVAKISADVVAQNREIDKVQQEIQIPDLRTQARLNTEITARQNLAQELYGG